MKTRFFFALWVTVVVIGVLAQSPSDLNIQPYAGLTIEGAVGTVYSIESIFPGAFYHRPSPRATARQA